ncbi:MAG TPA: hypothetical protein VK760_12590 [Candidatus Acidoferrales bacterium]|jgi:sugar lactone lactonase YvrE|nr:hypothetical protein [Candidatus Acidoferrales bacterium]
MNYRVRVLAILAAFTVLGGCASGPPVTPQPPLVASERSRPGASDGATLYVAEYSAKSLPSIAQYRIDDGSLVRRIVVGEYGIGALAVDRSGTLYIIENSYSHDRYRDRLVEYAPGATKPARTIVKDQWQPIAMLFNGAGDLYVLDRTSKLREFKPGATQAYEVVTDGLDDPTSMTIDPNGTVYVANAVAKKHSWGSVTVYAGGRHLVATIVDQILAPSGVALDGRGTLYVADPIGYGAPDYRSIAQYSTVDGRFLRTTTVTQNPNAQMSPGLAADSSGKIYTHLGGCFEIVGGPAHCVNKVIVYPPGATTPSRVYELGKGEAFLGLRLDPAANMYLAVCRRTPGAGCTVRVYGKGKSPRTILRVPQTLGAMAIAP